MSKFERLFIPSTNEKGEEVFYENVIYTAKRPADIARFSSVLNGVDYNRKLKPKHVAEIKNEILHGEFHGKYIAPVRIDINTGLTADGNHTMESYKQAWKEAEEEGYEGEIEMKFSFIELPKDEKKKHEVVKAINNSQEPWKIDDFVDSSLNMGEKGTITLVDWAKKHPLCYSKNKLSVRTAGCFIKGGNIRKEILNETLKFSKAEVDFANEIYPEVEAMFNILKFPRNNWLESFITAWWNIRHDAGQLNYLKKVGFNTILAHLNELSANWITISRLRYYEDCFRTAIFTTYSKVFESKEWEKID